MSDSLPPVNSMMRSMLYGAIDVAGPAAVRERARAATWRGGR